MIEVNQSRSVPGVSWQSLFLPTTGAAFFAYLLFLFLICRPLLLLGDGGTCRHVLTGLYIFQHHAVPSTNYVFALNPQAPWQTHELLADMLLGGAQLFFGLNGVVLICALSISLVLTWSYQLSRLRGMGLITGLLLLIAVMTATSIHWSARAHLFSYLPFMLLYLTLFGGILSARTQWVMAFLTLAVWANLHGSFVLGLYMVACKLAGDWFADGPAGITVLKSNAVLLLCGLAGSCLNIRGINLFGYVTAYASHPLIRFSSNESRSIDFSLGMPVFAYLFLMFALTIVWTYSSSPPRLSEVLFALSLFFGGLYAMRIIPYFALIALPAAAGSWPEIKRRISLDCEGTSMSCCVRLLRHIYGLEDKLDYRESRQIRQYGVFYAGCCLAVIAWLVLPFFRIADYDPDRLPVGAVTWLKEHHHDGLGFNPDNWGDYLYWRTGEPVFIDDKGDFYPPAFLREYMTFYSGGANWRDAIDRYRLSWLLLPNDLPALSFLTSDPSWRAAYRDNLVTIMEKQKDDAVRLKPGTR